MKPFETKNNLLKPVSVTSRYQQHGSPCLHEPVWLLTIAKNRLSLTLQATVFNVVNSARKMSTYLGIMSTMSGRLSTNSENDCQPHLEKSRKLSTEIRKRHLSFSLKKTPAGACVLVVFTLISALR